MANSPGGIPRPNAEFPGRAMAAFQAIPAGNSPRGLLGTRNFPGMRYQFGKFGPRASRLAFPGLLGGGGFHSYSARNREKQNRRFPRAHGANFAGNAPGFPALTPNSRGFSGSFPGRLLNASTYRPISRPRRFLPAGGYRPISRDGRPNCQILAFRVLLA